MSPRTIGAKWARTRPARSRECNGQQHELCTGYRGALETYLCGCTCHDAAPAGAARAERTDRGH